VSALLSLMQHKGQLCPPEVPAYQLIVAKLPLREDEDEAKKVHKTICEMLLSQNVGLMGPDNVPCLVEMNCRSHGWDGAWAPLAKMLTGGYSQPDVALDSHIDGAAFAKIPDCYPSPFKASGQNVMLVSFFAGTVRSTPGYDKMRKLSSFVALQTGVGIGSKVELTVDLFTAVGVLVLANSDAKLLEADLETVRTMEKEGLFTFDEEVDPMQFEVSPATIIPTGRRRAHSAESEAMLESAGIHQTVAPAKVAPRSATKGPALYLVAAAAFAAGATVGITLGRAGKR